MQVTMLNKKEMLLPGGLGIMYVPNGMVRDEVRKRWTISLKGLIMEFKDEPENMFGPVKSLAQAYVYTLENGETQHLRKPDEKFTPFGIQGIYRRGGLKPHYLIRVYGEEHQIDIGKVEKREAQQAMRKHTDLNKLLVPYDLKYSLSKIANYL